MTRQEQAQDFEYFTILRSRKTTAPEGYNRIALKVGDRFSRSRYGLERAVIRTSGALLNRYLSKRPHKKFDSRINIARTFVYASPSFRTLYEYMPGGFVTYHAYDPDKKYVKNGKRLDPLARSFFRHASDGLGVRSRAYAMAWRAVGRYKDATEVRWMSIACGVGQATFDAARLLPADISYFMLDMDKDALEAAHTMSKSYNIESDTFRTEHLNVIENNDRLIAHIKTFRPTIVDAMGLFEYLSPNDATKLLRSIYDHLDQGSSLFFTNMLPTHPHLDVHKRGMGWPGVIVRDEHTVVSLCVAAGIPVGQITTLRPDDGVYIVYEVVK